MLSVITASGIAAAATIEAPKVAAICKSDRPTWMQRGSILLVVLVYGDVEIREG